MKSSRILISTAGVLACIVSGVASWESDVHNQIGFMADALISDTTRRMVNAILEPAYKGSLGRAAAWADDVRKTTHKYSYTWHFISAKDDPPNHCELHYHRDCQVSGCVVQQISNQTNILESCIEKLHQGSYSPDTSCSEALKFVTHFIGDVAQPLHASDLSLGGNLVKVKFNGTDSNMHKVWDQDILYAYGAPKGFGNDTIHPFFVDIVSRIANDSFRAPRDTWNMCDLDSHRGTYCPELWAKDSNSIVCDYVYGRYVNGSDLFTGKENYAAGALHIMEEQVAKAAWRLSGWLNTLTHRVMYSERKPKMWDIRIQPDNGAGAREYDGEL